MLIRIQVRLSLKEDRHFGIIYFVDSVGRERSKLSVAFVCIVSFLEFISTSQVASSWRTRMCYYTEDSGAFLLQGVSNVWVWIIVLFIPNFYQLLRLHTIKYYGTMMTETARIFHLVVKLE